MAVILLELALLVWFLVTIIPLHPENLHLQKDALYTPYISSQDVSHIAVIITRWLFFALIAGMLIPINGIIIGELTRWFLDQGKKARLNRSSSDNNSL